MIYFLHTHTNTNLLYFFFPPSLSSLFLPLTCRKWALSSVCRSWQISSSLLLSSSRSFSSISMSRSALPTTARSFASNLARTYGTQVDGQIQSSLRYHEHILVYSSECVSVQIISKKCFHTTPLSINTQMFCLYMWTPMCLIRNAFTFGDLNFIWYMIFNSSYVIKDTKMTILLASL